MTAGITKTEAAGAIIMAPSVCTWLVSMTGGHPQDFGLLWWTALAAGLLLVIVGASDSGEADEPEGVPPGPWTLRCSFAFSVGGQIVKVSESELVVQDCDLIYRDTRNCTQCPRGMVLYHRRSGWLYFVEWGGETHYGSSVDLYDSEYLYGRPYWKAWRLSPSCYQKNANLALDYVFGRLGEKAVKELRSFLADNCPV